jgi:hypothetical protein
VSYINWATVNGCTSDSLWISPNLALTVLFLAASLRSTWLASDCNRCWCEASCHLLATYIQQHCLYPEILALVPRWGKCQDGSGDYVEVWCVPSAAHVPCIDHSHNNILTWECLLPYFLKVLRIYIAVWAGEFIDTGCSEWWSLCCICLYFYNELLVTVVNFTLLCPHNL